MVIFNLAIFRMRDSVDILKHAHARSSILDIWRKAEALYRVIGQVHRTSAGLLSFDVHNGVEINFRCFRSLFDLSVVLEILKFCVVF